MVVIDVIRANGVPWSLRERGLERVVEKDFGLPPVVEISPSLEKFPG
jgi:hypothetical protein